MTDSEKYIYLSTLVRILARDHISREEFVRLAKIEDDGDLNKQLLQYGYDTYDNLEKQYQDKIEYAYNQVLDVCPDPRLIKLFKYGFDCFNCKVLIKSKLSDLAGNWDSQLSRLGTFEIDDLKNYIQNGYYEELPETIGDTLKTAEEEYLKSGNPGRIDNIIDNCFNQLILQISREIENDCILNYYVAKTDLLNFLTALRIICMDISQNNVDYYHNITVSGGRLPGTFFDMALEQKDIKKLCDEIKSTAYGDVVFEIENNNYNPTIAGRIVDDYCLSLFCNEKEKLCGAEIPFGYLLAVQTEITNMRILISGKKSNMSPENIIERLRACDV